MAVLIKSKNINDAFCKIINTLKSEGKKVGPRGLTTLEVLNVIVEIESPDWRTNINNYYHKSSNRYFEGELEWYNNKGNLETIGKLGKFWLTLYNNQNEEVVNSNYGYRSKDNSLFTNKPPFDQIEHAFKLLKDDNLTRQAVVSIKLPDNLERRQGVKDVPCTIAWQYFIRDDKLCLTSYMRSNDVIWGFPYDIRYFIWQQHYMANKLNLRVGTITHHAGSMHIYEHHFDKLKEN